MKRGFELAGTRKQANVTQTELASELGWNAESVIDIERGRIGVDEETFALVLTTIPKVADRKKQGLEVTAA